MNTFCLLLYHFQDTHLYQLRALVWTLVSLIYITEFACLQLTHALKRTYKFSMKVLKGCHN